eukprot:TRINITY_DN4681_c0_g1_i1.p1 TRINITY_DN4681_c0_g1~~TRINITY_DN4681_c0_g1_i1.p1  ORF type:complete len:695 (-),score=103.89 TRINITY_DN4681_c0_g1_i1:1121-3205(-)
MASSRLWILLCAVAFLCGGSQAVNNNFTVVGRSNVDLTFPPSCFQRECSIGLFVADAIQSVSGADIAIVNGGFIRAGILQGDITVNMIENVAMWNDVIYLLNITGADLDVALENGVSNIDTYCPNTWDGRLAQPAGIHYSVDCSRPVGSRVTISQVQKGGSLMPYNATETYLLAANDFMVLSGGDGYTVFVGKGARAFRPTREIIHEYLDSLPNAVITSAPQGRITGLESCTPASCAAFTVATIPTSLPYHPDIVRSTETGIADFVVNSFTALCYARECDGALLDPSFITGGLDEGPIQESELLAIVANSTARPYFIEVQFSTIKSFLEEGPDLLDIVCDRRGLYQVSSKITMDVDCSLGPGLQINNLAIRGVFYTAQTADNWYAFITIESLARRLLSLGGRNLQPYAIDMRTFLEEYSHLTENGNVDFTRFTRIIQTGGGCNATACSTNAPFSYPLPVVSPPAAPTRPCENAVLEGQYYELSRLLGQGPFNYFNGRYNVTWDICNPLPQRCGAYCAPGTAAVCSVDTQPPGGIDCIPFFGGRATKYTPTANGGVNAPNATVGTAFIFGDGEVLAAKINVFCDESVTGKPNQEYLFQVPPRVEVQVMSPAGCPRAIPPQFAPQRAPQSAPVAKQAPVASNPSDSTGVSNANTIAIAIFIPLIVVFSLIIVLMAIYIVRRNKRGTLVASEEQANL